MVDLKEENYLHGHTPMMQQYLMESAAKPCHVYVCASLVSNKKHAGTAVTARVFASVAEWS